MLRLCATRALLRQYKTRLTGDTTTLPRVRGRESCGRPDTAHECWLHNTPPLHPPPAFPPPRLAQDLLSRELMRRLDKDPYAMNPPFPPMIEEVSSVDLGARQQ